MKKATSLLLSLILLISAAIVPVSATADSKRKYQRKSVTAYLFKKDDTAKLDCLFFDDLPDVPYVSADDYLNRIYTVKFTTTDHKNGSYTVKCDNGEMLVDVNKDTVHFDCFEDILYFDSVDANEEETADYIDWDEDQFNYQGKKNALDLDLSDYHLDLIGEGGKVYFPLYTISDIFSDTYLSAIYRGGDIYFIRTQDEEPYYDDSEIYDDLTREKSMIDFTYNELCFSIDHFYGKPPKAEIAKEIEEKGFDAAIGDYDDQTANAKKLLKSSSRIDFCKGLMILDNYFADGGHTMLSGGMIVQMNTASDSDFAKEIIKAITDPDDSDDAAAVKPIMDLSKEQSQKNALSSTKDKALESIKSVKEWDDAAFYTQDKTGYFVFDEFKDAVVEPFKWSLDYAAKNKLKNFVIDVTTNGGGAQAVVFYMLSVISGDSALYQLNTLTENLFKEDPKVDRNLDDKFDSKDNDLKYDLNFAVLTSKHSFSSANMLPCIAKKNGVAIIGENSGGGTCALSVRFMPDGSYYYMSSDIKITYSDGGDVDGGAAPDTALDTSDSYEHFYDFGAIQMGVEAFYEKKAKEPTDSPTEAPSEESTQITDETEAESDGAYAGRSIASDLTILYIILGAMAVILVIMVILIIMLVKSKKKAPDNE